MIKLVHIVGIPGSGKTTFANAIATHIGINQILATDFVKSVASFYEPKNKFLSTKTHTAWKLIGGCTNKNIITGYKKHLVELRKPLYSVIDEWIEGEKHLIIEGVHIDMNLFNKYSIKCKSILFFLEVSPEQHSKLLDQKLTKQTANGSYKEWIKNKEYMQSIQKFIKDKFSNKNDVVILKNNSSLGNLIKSAKPYITAYLERN